MTAIEALVQEIGRAAAGDAEASLGRVLIEDLGAEQRGNLDAGGRIRLGDGRFLVVVTPADDRNDFNWLATFLDEVKAAERRVLGELGDPPLSILHAGAPVLVVDEMDASRRDVTRSTLLALVLVSLLFSASFHSVRHVGAAVAALLAGLGLTFGAALLLVGLLGTAIGQAQGYAYVAAQGGDVALLAHVASISLNPFILAVLMATVGAVVLALPAPKRATELQAQAQAQQ